MSATLRSLLILAFLPSLPASCAARHDYFLRVEQPHKDVAVVTVRVPGRLDPDGYRRIAEAELPRVLASRHGQGVPLYEVRFDFLAPPGPSGQDERAATFVWRAEGLAAGAPSHAGERSLVLY